MKILIIEDNAADLVLTETKIKKLWPELEIQAARSMYHTYKIAKQQTFDLILLDLNLPDGHGVRSITEVQKFIDYAPIAVLTGHIDPIIERESLKAGAVKVLSKNALMNNSFAETLGALIKKYTPTDNKPMKSKT